MTCRIHAGSRTRGNPTSGTVRVGRVADPDRAQQVRRVADEEGGDVLVSRPGLGRRRAADGVARRRPLAGEVALEDVVGGVGDLVDSTRWQPGDSTGRSVPSVVTIFVTTIGWQ